MYMNVYGFKKNQIFTQNPYVLANDFTGNRNTVFLGRDPDTADQLYIIVSYMSFYGFSKISNFRSKYISVSLRFYQKVHMVLPKITSFCQNLIETLYFLLVCLILRISYP
jgi:hypothetical protein